LSLAPKSTADFLRSHRSLLAHLNAQKKLLGEIQRILDPASAKHCVHAQIRNQQLVIFTDSSLWSSRVRMQGNRITKQLPRDYGTLESIHVRIFLQQRNLENKRTIQPVTVDSARSIEESADAIDDQRLSDALRRLSRSVLRN